MAEVTAGPTASVGDSTLDRVRSGEVVTTVDGNGSVSRIEMDVFTELTPLACLDVLFGLLVVSWDSSRATDVVVVSTSG